MVYVEITSSKSTGGEVWKPKKENDYIEGILKNKRKDVGPNKSTMYDLEIENGEIRSIWGMTALNLKMVDINEGDKIKILYEGKKLNEKTKRTFHSYKVFRNE